MEVKNFTREHWWEWKSIDDMPEYLLLIRSMFEIPAQTYWQVTEKGLFEYPKEEMDKDASPFFCKLKGINNRRFNYSHFVPATKEEYEAFIKENK